MGASLIGLLHSFCSAAYSGDAGADRYDDDEISEALDATDTVVFDRARVEATVSSGGGGTDSTISSAFWKRSWR